MARTKQVPTVTKKGGKPKNEKVPRKKAEVLKKPKAVKSSKSSKAGKIQKPEKRVARKSDVDSEKKERKARRFKASTIAARECKRYSSGKKDGTRLLIQRKPFSNLIRERLQEFDDTMRIKKSALHDIQEGMESWLEEGMERTHPLCRLGKKMAPTAKIVKMAIEPIFYGQRS